MSIIKDHSITKILKNKTLRNDPEVIEAVCDVLKGLDGDIDKVGELIVGPKTDKALEELNDAVTRAENQDNEEDLEIDEDEDLDFLGDEDEDDLDEEDEDHGFTSVDVEDDDDDEIRG